MSLDWTALAITTGFIVALSAAVGTYSSLAGSAGTARRLRRRLAPSPDLPELARPRVNVGAVIARGLTPLARLATPVKEDEISELRRKLVHAGFRSSFAVQAFLGAKVFLAVVAVLAILWVSAQRVDPVPRLGMWVFVAASVGFFAPNGWLASRVRERQRRISEGLPDALDLLVTCVEAGLGLDAAVQRVADELSLAHPILGEELVLTFLETKAGARRADALRHLAERTGVQDLKTLSATLNQTELFGTSVGAALRVQADALRTRRMHGAEEQAGALSVKMSIPLVVCFLPALLAVILGPVFVNIIETLRLR